VTPNEVAQIQQQLTALTEHVKRLEVENSRRWHRELVFYPALLGYIFLQVARWLVINK
jgi:Mitochondrial and peroxisomal fission factor Mff